MPIRPEFYVNLKGKQYPVYAGVLIAAIEAGLKSLTVDHVQLPSEENGQTAVMKARAEFEDGRVFQDYGDCSPRNTSPQIATASIRMASTRAKGRVLRDGIGLGETLKEELPDDDEAPAVRREAAPAVSRAESNGARQAAAPPAAQGANAARLTCAVCEKPMSRNEQTYSQHHLKLNVCKECVKPLVEEAAAAKAAAG